MKNKKFLAVLASIAVMAPLTLGLAGCGKDNSLNIVARDVYAMSAVSSAEYLSSEKQEIATSYKEVNASKYLLLEDTAMGRPSTLTQNDVLGVKNCLNMFNDILVGGDVNQTTVKNTEQDGEYAKYNFVMNITIPNVVGSADAFKMYYDEIRTDTKVEIEDNEEELEVSTTLEGVLVMGEETFSVKGIREYEKEGRDEEVSIEFYTYANKLEGSQTVIDNQNYVHVSQSVENNEIEYEYVIYKNGKKIQDTELEFEQERNKTGIEFQFKDTTTGVRQETIFRAEKRANENGYTIRFTKNGKNDTFTAQLTSSGYKFVYSNGYEETISTNA